MKSSQIRGGSNCHVTNENRSLKIFLLGWQQIGMGKAILDIIVLIQELKLWSQNM